LAGNYIPNLNHFFLLLHPSIYVGKSTLGKKIVKKNENQSDKNENREKSQSNVPEYYPNASQKPVFVKEIKQKEMYRMDGSFNIESYFDILGSDIRRKILSKLAKFPRYASDLAIDLGVTKQAIKKHLDRLVKFGIVEEIPAQTPDQKIQYFQIALNMAAFAQIDITPNYFHLHGENFPEELANQLRLLAADPQTAIILRPEQPINYEQLNFGLKALGTELHSTEMRIGQIEKDRKQLLLEKASILNRIQSIINTLVTDDLEKEVLQSIFFDVKSSVEGVTLEDILNRLFLRKKIRSGIAKTDTITIDEKMKDRGQRLLQLLRLLIQNFRFIQTEGNKLFFDFEETHS
jgi:predicted transcriptional regulator